MAINALEIWGKISESDVCKTAVNLFGTTQKERRVVLERGDANFDKKATGFSEADVFMRVAYYMSSSGSMDMHIKQNRQSCSRYLADLPDDKKTVLVVDFGCGPMTAGLSIAEHLSQKMSDYKSNTFYYGIDISEQMCKAAREINTCFSIFDDDKYFVSNDSRITIPHKPFLQCSIVVLTCSFVLGADTLKNSSTIEISNSLADLFAMCPLLEEIRVIFHNPNKGSADVEWWQSNFLKNWEQFRGELKKLWDKTNFRYDATAIEDCNWMNGRDRSAMAMIKGTKEAES